MSYNIAIITTLIPYNSLFNINNENKTTATLFDVKL